MASFVMHYVAGEKFLSGINYKLSIRNKNNFRLGNLVVDTIGISDYDRDTKLDKKMITHFRDEEDRDKCMQLPNTSIFMDKYRDLVIKDYSAMGYLFHLYTDKVFFKYLYDKVIECYDINKIKTDNISDSYYVKVKKSNTIYKIYDFYSGNKMGLYNDYSKMNKYLIDKYKINFDYNNLKKFSITSFNNPGIEEVNYKNISEIIDKMKLIINSSIFNRVDSLSIFDIDDIDKLLLLVVNSFNYEYSDEVKKLIKKK